MGDRFIEHFIINGEQAQAELEKLELAYVDCGMYPCGGGYVVWADRDSACRYRQGALGAGSRFARQ